MAHFKRRRRKTGGFKGCCVLCSLRSTDGRRNGRRRTRQEIAALLHHAEGEDEWEELSTRKARAARWSSWWKIAGNE